VNTNFSNRVTPTPLHVTSQRRHQASFPDTFPSAEKYHPGPRGSQVELEIEVSVVVKVLGLFGERYQG